MVPRPPREKSRKPCNFKTKDVCNCSTCLTPGVSKPSTTSTVSAESPSCIVQVPCERYAWHLALGFGWTCTVSCVCLKPSLELLTCAAHAAAMGESQTPYESAKSNAVEGHRSDSLAQSQMSDNTIGDYEFVPPAAEPSEPSDSVAEAASKSPLQTWQSADRVPSSL